MEEFFGPSSLWGDVIYLGNIQKFIQDTFTFRRLRKSNIGSKLSTLKDGKSLIWARLKDISLSLEDLICNIIRNA
jgi:hypothetical protein